MPAPAEAHIETLRTALGNLLIFLNLTFLQSYLFFGTRATNMDKFVSELLQAGLVPENPVASINRLSLPLRGVGHRNFFTFALARLMGADNDLNPLLPIRELWEYLVNPEGPFDETLPIAQNGFGSILGMVKAMHENPLVFRVPNKRPPVYADLSGPKATVLPESAWPEIDLPEGELVVLGRDRSEALGLWPFFTPTNKGIALVEPTPEQLSELLSRLELAPG